MKIRLERDGDDLVAPLPEEFVEHYGLKEGDWIDAGALVAELEKHGHRGASESGHSDN
jgi:hypothetical protein